MLRKLATALFCTSLHGAAWGLGLGDIQVESGLNQAFLASIPLTTVSAEERQSLQVRIAQAAEFERAGIERNDYLSTLKFEVMGSTIRVTSDQIAREPVLDLLVEARSTDGRVMRAYSVLLDPPTLAAARPESAPAVAAESAVPVPVAPEPPAVSRPQPVPVAEPPSVPVQPVAPVAPAADAAVASTTADAVTAGEAGQYGPVRPQETFWSIATRLRPDSSITMDQMLLALYRANASAFVGGINGLRQGSVLTIPPVEQIAAIPPAQAKAQMDVLRAGRRPAVPRAAAAPRATSAKPVAAPPAAPAPAAEVSQATEPVAPPAAAADAATPATTPPPAEEAGAAQSAAEKSTPQAAPAAEAAAAAQASAAGSAAPAEAAAPLAGEPGPAPGAAAQKAEQAADDEAAGPKTVTFPSATGVGLGPYAMPLGIGLILVLLLLLVYRRRREKERATASADLPQRPVQAVSPASVAAAAAASAPPAAAAPAPKPAPARLQDSAKQEAAPVQPPAPVESSDKTESAPLPDFDSTQIFDTAAPTAAQTSTLATDTVDFDVTSQFAADTLQINLDANDPISEADFHLAYGLYDEAALLLKQAVAREPQRTDLRIKLAETYFAAGKPVEFQETAEGLKSQLGEPEWQKLAILGRQICPDAALFKGADSADLGTVDLAFDEPEDSPLKASPPEAAGSQAAADQPQNQPPAAALELGPLEPLTPPQAAQTPPAGAPETAKPEGNLLDFNLEDLELPAQSRAGGAQELGIQTEDANLLEFDLSEFDLAPAAESSKGQPDLPVAADLGIELDTEHFDLSGAFDDKPGEGEAPAVPLTDLEIKLNDFDLGELPPEGSIASDDEIGTKLDLARAYVDMGDNEMARSLLSEVAQQGNAGQQTEAQSLLARLPA